MTQNILIVDDQPLQVQFLQTALKADGHNIDYAKDLKSARDFVSSKIYSLIILDREIVKDYGAEDGLHFCREFRDMGASSRIVFFTNLVSPSEHREGWAAGADDYIEKSWAPEVALARCRAHLSRVLPHAVDSGTLKVFTHPDIAEDRDLLIEEASLTVSRREDFELVRHGGLMKARLEYEERERYKKAKMTDIDLAVFFTLYKRPLEWFSEQDLLRQVWGYSEQRIEKMISDPDSNSGLVHTTVSRIRRKVDTRLERKATHHSRLDNIRPWAFIETSNDETQSSVSYRFNPRTYDVGLQAR